MDDRYPEWVRQLNGWLPVSPQVVLTGRVDDQHVAPHGNGELAPRRTSDLIAECLRQRGFPLVIGWNPLLGAFALHEEREGDANGFVSSNVQGQSGPAVLATLMEAVVSAPRRVGLVLHSVPRLTPTQEHEALNLFYARARELAVAATPRIFDEERATRRDPIYNTVIWAVGQEAELPHWLVAAEGVRIVSIPDATLATRREAASVRAVRLPGFAELTEVQKAWVLDRLADETAGMSLTELLRTMPLARDRNIGAAEVENAVRFLRSGVIRSPWRDPELRHRIAEGETRLNEQVRGQPRAVRKAVSILARAALGLSGAQSPGHPTRPQGVMFLVGPTGSGKTELAKQIAMMVFGREDSMVRFDMSEFSAEQSEARLIGSPPGFVGHGDGGELTNAVRRNPFSLLLFDEIEKAHPRILDKFLQILEDGRLTDGSGNTVHFTETLIVFTSNMGIHKRENPDDPMSPLVRNVDPGDPYEKIQTTVLAAIKAEFTQIQRPELLNRIGDNIVVFDFLSAPVACELIDRNLANLARQVTDQAGFQVTFAPDVHRQLHVEASKDENLAFGGRQMSNLVDGWVVTPLSLRLLSMRSGPVTVSRLVETSLPSDRTATVREVDVR